MKRSRLTEDGAVLLRQYGLTKREADCAEEMVFECGEHLLLAGTEVDRLLFVCAGKAKVCLCAPNGKRLLLSYFLSRGVVGDMEWLAGRACALSTVQAVTRCRAVALPLERCGDALWQNAAFLGCLGREIADKLMHASERGASSVLCPLEERLAGYILQTAQDGCFSETFTEVSELLGTSYRHLLRALSAMRDSGVLERTPCGYRILDRAKLEKLAGDA